MRNLVSRALVLTLCLLVACSAQSAAPTPIALAPTPEPTAAPTAAPATPTAIPAALPTIVPCAPPPAYSAPYPEPGAALPPGAIALDLPPAPRGATVPDAVIALAIEGHQLEAEVVTNPGTRSSGLMFRESLPADRGMLFVFPTPYASTFTMMNTYVPLSIAFIGEDRRIINIVDMAPLDTATPYAPTAPALYALEVNQGWFAERGIGPGALVEFELPPDLPVC